MYDSGAAVQNIMLLAVNYGLGTIAQAMAVVYPDIIHKELGIPDDKCIALALPTDILTGIIRRQRISATGNPWIQW